MSRQLRTVYYVAFEEDREADVFGRAAEWLRHHDPDGDRFTVLASHFKQVNVDRLTYILELFVEIM